jgi:hypothetical protein
VYFINRTEYPPPRIQSTKLHLRRILLGEFCLRCPLFQEKSCWRMLFVKKQMSLGISFLVSCLIYRFISTANNLKFKRSHSLCQKSASIDIIRLCVTVTVENNFEKTKSFRQICVCVGCQLNSDQTLRLFCLNRHVRVRVSTL